MSRAADLRRRWLGTWSRLAVRERRILALVCYEGLTPLETARALGLSLREVQGVLQLRRQRLRRQLRVPFLALPARPVRPLRPARKAA